MTKRLKKPPSGLAARGRDKKAQRSTTTSNTAPVKENRKSENPPGEEQAEPMMPQMTQFKITNFWQAKSLRPEIRQTVPAESLALEFSSSGERTAMNPSTL